MDRVPEKMASRKEENKDRQDDPENDVSAKGSVRVVSGSGFRYVVPFPWRLHQMLEAIDEAGDASIVSWLSDGQHFQVHNPQSFVQKVIPKFFKQKSYKSFQRQLHLYGFRRETEGVNRGAYFHENFLRSNRQLSLEISRTKAPKRRRPSTQAKASAKGESKFVSNKAGALSVLDRFQPLKPIESTTIVPVRSSISEKGIFDSNYDSLKPHQPSPTCLNKNYKSPVEGFEGNSHSSKKSRKDRQMQILQSNQTMKDRAASETYEWLINSGVPFSAFDPVSFDANPSVSSDLYDCAEEITSLFVSSALATPTSESSDISSPSLFSGVDQSFGFNCDDASLAMPEHILGQFSESIWGA